MFKIEIKTKEGFKDVRGEHILSDINAIGISCVSKAQYSPLYIIEGDIDFANAEIIAKELLTDKITENYSINNEEKNSFAAGSVEVWYKKGVTDTTSQSIIKAVKDLGIDKQIKVKTGHKYYLYGKISKDILNEIAVKLLANTLIQEYKIENYD